MKTPIRWLPALLLLASVQVHAGPVDINTADAAALAEAIDGVGTQRAETIVQYRNQHGPFRSVDDLAKVKGIGEKTVARNRGNLTVEAPASP